MVCRLDKERIQHWSDGATLIQPINRFNLGLITFYQLSRRITICSSWYKLIRSKTRRKYDSLFIASYLNTLKSIKNRGGGYKWKA